MGKLTISRRYNLGTFAAVKPWRVGRELAVQDLPVAKIVQVRVKSKYIWNFTERSLSKTLVKDSASESNIQKNSLNLHSIMEEQEGNRIIRINILQASMTLGTYLGLYIILAYWITALTVSHVTLSLLALPLMIGIPVVAFFLIRRFRDSTKAPFFPFPVSWMLSILTFLFATVLSCMAAYLYLRFRVYARHHVIGRKHNVWK